MHKLFIRGCGLHLLTFLPQVFKMAEKKGGINVPFLYVTVWYLWQIIYNMILQSIGRRVVDNVLFKQKNFWQLLCRIILQSIWKRVVGNVLLKFSSSNISSTVLLLESFCRDCQAPFGSFEHIFSYILLPHSPVMMGLTLSHSQFP